jgi:hypothetical protein
MTTTTFSLGFWIHELHVVGTVVLGLGYWHNYGSDIWYAYAACPIWAYTTSGSYGVRYRQALRRRKAFSQCPFTGRVAYSSNRFSQMSNNFRSFPSDMKGR